jgi:hypothetical protein
MMRRREASEDRALAQAVQNFLAKALSGTTLRNMGPAGTVECVRNYLKGIDLAEFASADADGFRNALDRHTSALSKCLSGKDGEKWGVARKSLNLFLRDAAYNFYLRQRYHLDAISRLLEVPLDSRVGHQLRDEPEGKRLRAWKTVKGLTPELSDEFQGVAARVAERKRTDRVHLDLEYWPR